MNTTTQQGNTMNTVCNIIKCNKCKNVINVKMSYTSYGKRTFRCKRPNT